MTEFEQAQKYILSIPMFAGKHTLEDTRRLLNKLCDREINPKIIHVAGTNGKGSVCAYLCSILKEAGCRTGLFTSPHLITMRERICIGYDMISENEFTEIFRSVKAGVLADQDNHPSFFEFLFLMAMVYFTDRKVEYIILETGMGGRLDATNSIDHPNMCVITSIGYDHMQYLGNTIEEIASEKAGIMKPKVPVIFYDKNKKITKILTDYAKKTGSPAIIIKKPHILNVNINNKSIDFSYQSGYYNYISLSLATKALYQIENAVLAVSAAERLEDERIMPNVIRAGLHKTRWSGRMEEVLDGIILDGAHNADGMAAFLESVKMDRCIGRRFLLFGVVSDKRYETMIELINEYNLFDVIAVTTIASDRSVSKDKLKKVFEQFNMLHCIYFKKAEEAYCFLKADKKGEDLIYIAGSLYLAGQIKSFMKENIK